MLEAGPTIISSIMGLYPPAFVTRMKASGIRWFANVTTVTEAKAAEAAGADALVAQGMEAGGHRGAFDAAQADLARVAEIVEDSTLPPVVGDPVENQRFVDEARALARRLIARHDDNEGLAGR